MRPELTEEQLDELPSQAEARFYRACRDQLGDRILVLHSVRFVQLRPSGISRDGEADFVVCDPDGGFAVVEVKGGGVAFDGVHAVWSSLNSKGAQHSIKNPIEQAMTQKKVLLDLIRKDKLWVELGSPMVLAAHGVFFPDVRDVSPFVSPRCTRDMVGGNFDLQNLKRWVSGLFRMWSGGDRRLKPLRKEGLAIMEDIFCRTVEVRPLVSVQLRDEEVRRIRLTEQQYRILRALGNRSRAAICGGAGTGKTILAAQRARELAAAGKRTLLLCYNRPLADHLRFSVGSSELLRPMTFHQLCDWLVAEVRKAKGRDLLAEARDAYPNEDLYDVQMPYACGLAADVLPVRFDAIIIDEGQDFRPEFWMPVEMLLADPDKSTLLVFYDQNQAIYHALDDCPVTEDPFVLTVNCRNTRFIHEAAYRYFEGDATDPCEIDGVPVREIVAVTPPEQATLLRKELANLIDSERVRPDEIAVLVAGKPKEAYYTLLVNSTLPRAAKWSTGVHRIDGAVTVDTVGRFKGLEAAIIFLWAIDDLRPEGDRETIYVGMSRAKSRLFLVGTSAACKALQSQAALVTAAVKLGP